MEHRRFLNIHHFNKHHFKHRRLKDFSRSDEKRIFSINLVTVSFFTLFLQSYSRHRMHTYFMALFVELLSHRIINMIMTHEELKINLKNKMNHLTKQTYSCFYIASIWIPSFSIEKLENSIFNCVVESQCYHLWNILKVESSWHS